MFIMTKKTVEIKVSINNFTFQAGRKRNQAAVT